MRSSSDAIKSSIELPSSSIFGQLHQSLASHTLHDVYAHFLCSITLLLVPQTGQSDTFIALMLGLQGLVP